MFVKKSLCLYFIVWNAELISGRLINKNLKLEIVQVVRKTVAHDYYNTIIKTTFYKCLDFSYLDMEHGHPLNAKQS